MLRAQIQLEEEQARRLRALAAERNVSISALVREAVDGLLRSTRANRLGARLAEGPAFRSGLGDAAERHDDYLAEDFLD